MTFPASRASLQTQIMASQLKFQQQALAAYEASMTSTGPRRLVIIDIEREQRRSEGEEVDNKPVKLSMKAIKAAGGVVGYKPYPYGEYNLILSVTGGAKELNTAFSHVAGVLDSEEIAVLLLQKGWADLVDYDLNEVHEVELEWSNMSDEGESVPLTTSDFKRLLGALYITDDNRRYSGVRLVNVHVLPDNQLVLYFVTKLEDEAEEEIRDVVQEYLPETFGSLVNGTVLVDGELQLDESEGQSTIELALPKGSKWKRRKSMLQYTYTYHT